MRLLPLTRAATLWLALGVAACGQDDPGNTSAGSAGSGGAAAGGAGAAGGGAGGMGACAGDGCGDASADISIEGDGGTDAPSLDEGDSGDESDAADAGELEAETSDEPPAADAPQESGDEADASEPRDSSEVPEAADGRDDHDEARMPDGGTDADAGDGSDAASAWASGPPHWLPAAPMTASRVNFGATLVPTGVKKGKILAIGGSFEAPSTYESFDGTSWTSDATPIDWAENTATTGADGKVYVFMRSASNALALDGSWKSIAPRPHTTPPSAATGSDGLIYVGGTLGNTTSIDIYRPPIDQWSTLAKAKPHQVNGDPLLVSLGSKIYVLGDTVRQRAFEAYDVNTATWSSLADVPMPPMGVALAVGGDGRIYAIGGIPGSTTVNAVVAYDAATDRWDTVAPMITARDMHATATGPDGRIYALGGTPGNATLKSVEAYGPVAALTKTHAPPGTVVLVTGNNFAANANVALYVGPVQGAPLATSKTNGTGGLAPAIVFKVPAGAAEGDTYVSVVDDRSRFPIAIPFTVEASP